MKTIYHTKVLQIIEDWNLNYNFVARALGIQVQSVKDKASPARKEFFNKKNLYNLEIYIISKAQELEKQSEFFQ